MDIFFNTLKDSDNVEKSLKEVEMQVNDEYEKIKERQEKEMMSLKEAQILYENNLEIVKRYERIKKIQKYDKENKL
ncbi:hypothetical protein BDAP_002531 [Binucleata daphniae]